MSAARCRASLCAAHPGLPALTLRGFVAVVNARPGPVNHGSAGNGSAGHPAVGCLKTASNAIVRHRPAARRPAATHAAMLAR